MFGHNNKLDVDWLGEIEFFHDFDRELLAKIAHLGERIDIPAGTELIDQGRVGDACYVIVEGSANVSISGRHVATVGPGSMVGEMALVSHRPRNATVRAETPLTVVEFGASEFRALLHSSPEVAHRVLSLLDERAAEDEAL